MNPILESIFATRKFVNSKNETIEINSETPKEQCAFLQDIISKNKFKNSIEVGFAYGTSTLAIVEEVAKNGGQHVVIDKFQNEGWAGNGLDLIEQAGYSDKLEFMGEFCFTALPKLLLGNRRFDFAYIDSTKEFDWLLVDFFYIDQMLAIGGVIVFDDLAFPGITKLLRLLSQMPHYKVYAHYPKNYGPTRLEKRKLELLRFLPFSKRLFKEEIKKTNYELGINAKCVALLKVDNDKRNWDWHVDF